MLFGTLLVQLLLVKVKMEMGWWAVVFVVNNASIHWTKIFHLLPHFRLFLPLQFNIFLFSHLNLFFSIQFGLISVSCRGLHLVVATALQKSFFPPFPQAFSSRWLVQA